MRTLVQNGYVRTYTNPSAENAIASGGVVGPFGTANRFGVAKVAIEASGQGAVAEGGVHELPATAADDWADGDTLYWDVADGKLTDDADTGTNKAIGSAWGAKAAAATTAKVLLNNQPMPLGS